jgi:hypothetical protein
MTTAIDETAEIEDRDSLGLSPDHVLKRADGDTARSINQDMAMHQQLLSATKNHNLSFLAPRSYKILEASDPAYPTNFPADRLPCQTYAQERISALPLAIRTELIARNCPANLQASVRTSRKDEDCLVRLYTGRRRAKQERARPNRFFTLRNYTLCVDQMEDLQIDVNRVVKVLAKALAVCYWVAGIDANDCEWVFGSPPSTESEKEVKPGQARSTAHRMEEVEMFKLGGENCAIWMLDFDCVRQMAQDEGGVQQAVDAFWRNDPYFPRPWTNQQTPEDQRLWRLFVEKFLEESESCEGISTEILGTIDPQRMRLAKLWIERMEVEGARRASSSEVLKAFEKWAPDVS